MYQILSGDLGIDVNVSELKMLNKYLLSKQEEALVDDEGAQFLDQDEQSIDLIFLSKLLPKKPVPTYGQSGSSQQDREMIENL